MSKTISILFLVCMLTGCGGGGGNTNLRTDYYDFSGNWEVTYNIILDECDLLVDEFTGFSDTHVVIQEDNAISVESEQLPTGSYTGLTRDAGDSFLVEHILSGDLFGSGVNCDLIEGLSYNNFDNEQADTLYKVQIVCENGDRCDSVVRGVAIRTE